jgi:hypothetical protein
LVAIHYRFVAGQPVLADNSTHGWMVGLVNGVAVIIVSETSVQPGSSPPAWQIALALAAARGV